MNKKISTLLAATLVAGGFSSNAFAQTKAGELGDMLAGVKTGDFVTLNAAGPILQRTTGSLVSFSNGTFDYVTLTSLTGGDAEAAFSGMWTIEVIPGVGTAGTPTYSFVNKLTGLPFAVNLQTNKGGESTDAAIFDEEGNTEWAYNSELGLYHVAKDSTFYFGEGYKLKAVKGGLEVALKAGDAAVISPVIVAEGLKLSLTPKVFNQISTTGKLKFNNKKNVLNSSVENFLETKTWKAFSAVSGKGDNAKSFILATDASTASGNPYVLVVDTNYYDLADQFHHFAIDTLGAKPVYDENDKNKLAVYENNWYREIMKAGEVDKTIGLRPIESASFRGSYFLAEDSVVLYANYEPGTVVEEAFDGVPAGAAKDAFFTFGSDKYSNLSNVKNAVNVVIDTKKAAYSEVANLELKDVTSLSFDRNNGYTVVIVNTYTIARSGNIGSFRYNFAGVAYRDLDDAKNAVKNAIISDATTAKATVQGWAEGQESYEVDYLGDVAVIYTPAVAATPAIPAHAEYRKIAVEATELGHIALTPLDKNKIVLTPSYDAAIETEEAATAANFILPLIQPEYVLDLEDGRTTIADDVYTIQNEKGKYLASPINVNGNYADWVELNEDFQNVEHLPAYQWVVLKDRKSSGKSPITLVNREYEGLNQKAVQLYLNEDNEIVAGGEDGLFYNDGALTFKAVSAAAKGDSLLGYKNMDADSLKVLRYTFNHFSPYDASQYIGVSSKDSVMVVKGSKTSFTIANGSHDKFGFEVTEDAAERIAGLKQLYRTVYAMRVEEPKHLNFGVNINEDNKFIASKFVGSYPVYFKENNCDETAEYYALVYNSGYSRAGVAENTKDAVLKSTTYSDVNVSVFDIAVNKAPLYRTLYKADGSLAATDTIKIFSVNNDDEFLGVEANPAYMLKDIHFLGMEKAKAGTGYGLIADSVRVQRGLGYIKPQYLLSVDRKVVVGKDGVPCPDHGFDPNCPHWIPGTASFVRGNFLVNTIDSVKAGNKDYTWSNNDSYIRPAFVDAIHIGDSLYILKDKFAGLANAAIDTAAIIKANNATATKGRYIIDLKGDSHKKCTFSFRYVDPAAHAEDAEKDAFLIESMPYNAGNDIAPYDAYWVRLQNNVVVIANEAFTGTWDDAMAFDLASMGEGDKVATDNEEIATSTISVIAGEGQVSIAGAQGKKVVISNVLGQVIANTVIASDNATIAAPAGVVVVAVEGEAAVKAIVK